MADIKYGDEEIARIMNMHKRGVKGDCRQGFIVCEDYYECIKHNISNVFNIYLPIRFERLYGDEIEKNFGRKDIEYVYKYKTRNMDVQINEIHGDITEENICDVTNDLTAFVDDCDNISASSWKRIDYDNFKVTYIDMVINTFYGQRNIRNVYVLVDGRCFFINFVCSIYDKEIWSQVFDDIIKNLTR